MSRPSRIAKRLLLPALLVAALVVAVQVVFAAPPVPSFTVTGPNDGTSCGLWTLDSTSQDPDADIASTDWTIDGNPTTGDPATVTFASTGSHVINMSVTDGSLGDGDAGPETVAAPQQTITVTNSPPTAVINAPTAAVAVGADVTFTAAGSADPGGAITKYEWDLDGLAGYEADSGTTPSFTRKYTTAGTRTVRIRVTDSCNVSTTDLASVTVQNAEPSFAPSVNPVQPGVPVTFTANTDPSITGYAWDLDGNGSFETPTGATNTAQKTYTALESGPILVGLQVTYSDTSTRSAVRLLTVNTLPEANFTYDRNPPIVGEPVTFSPTGSRDFAGGSITSYQWDLDGNGTYETPGATPAHVYGAVGTVSVGLKVTDNDGGTTEVHKPVQVQATRPNASLTFSPENPLPGQAVTLTSTSTQSTTAGAPALQATQWDFDFPVTEEFSLDAAGGSVVTSFPTPGNKRVAVRVTDASGGFAIANATIPVNAPPQASFTASPSKPIEGRPVTFASTSGDPDGPLAKQEWDFNNDGTWDRTGGVVSTSRLKKGTRPIKLRVTDSKGAVATATVPVKVAAKPLLKPQNVVSSVSYERRAWGIVVVGFSLKTPSKTSVAVTCKGRGCPRGTFRKRTRTKSATLSFPQLAGGLRAGAKINIVFTKPGRLTGWDVITVKPGKTALREGCKIGRAKKQKRCP